jgi:hypothetical protein
MTLFLSHDLTCGRCGKGSAQTVLSRPIPHGVPDLDLRPAEPARSTQFAWLQYCPYCDYCAPDISQAPRNVAALGSAAYQAALDRPDFPEVARWFLAYAVSCSPVSPIDAAYAFLHTAWVCDDHDRVREAAVARQLSASWFLKCRPFPPTEEGFMNGAVLVDVLRRCGRFEEAARECEALLFLAALPAAVRARLLLEQRLIHAQDWRCHSVAESRTVG